MYVKCFIYLSFIPRTYLTIQVLSLIQIYEKETMKITLNKYVFVINCNKLRSNKILIYISFSIKIKIKTNVYIIKLKKN